jgi:16S rRNA processing protein RimM
MPEPSKDMRGKPAAGDPATGSPAASRSRRRPPKARRLIDTAGPDPAAAIDDVRLTVGVIVGSHGVQGELRMSLQTDDPDNLLDIERIYLGDTDEPVALEGIRFHGEGALIFLAGIETPEQAKALRGTPVRIAGGDARPLEPGEHFYYQLIGLKAVTPDGARLGEVVDIIETGAHDVLVIAPEGSRASRSPANEVLIPYHASYVLDVDTEGGTITVIKPVYSDEAASG